MDRALRLLARVAPGPVVGAVAVAALVFMSGAPTAAHRVPALRGLEVNRAIAQAADEGFFTRVVRRPLGGVAGRVVRQSPEVGVVREKTTTLTLVVTTGAHQVRVPDVTKMPLEQARRRLAEAHLKPGEVAYRRVEDTPADQVVSTDPRPERSVDVESTVDLVVAS